MSNQLNFKELNFKLAVINELMYVQEVLEPKLDVYEFIEKQRNLSSSEAYDVIEEEGYEIIPEVLEHFKNLELTSEMVENIEELDMDGGDEIYGQIIPFWDGEDDVFSVNSAVDAELLPNLKNISLLYSENDSLLEEFQEKGIEADWL
ncbi:DUF6892 domain-containing protein [Tenacibaculum mesophilum]|uniref:DUF6892 domain-containing protein n=1 Tax=Tenacibaculum mesophilum TaxID=104268 RepID=A0ABM7CBT8_9FLAO|nr:hypothetical protein [Tenacibaculum mesophilum]GFD83191.1 hypothetical protein KUL118_60530 [Tenacibaculum sp. KUL118]AZJ31190.1 hypothetical protein D6200_00825 [Tenacibaculum mesophilum]QFS29237.1 hypothetical protein F9Y86_12820 [Tenacibaculum mesophilum]SHF50262.1 hypothetical protein SAMN05444344_0164 [Tenacibaculum mesophilum]BFF40498.1 hypothetical protein BACY1_23030 [Tenacibaculum mesophilum]